MRSLLLLISLFSLSAYGQKLPPVNFNHVYIVIDPSDLSAIQNSDFIKNKFAATITRTTKADSAATWTGTYLQGLDNYFEIFDSSGAGEPTGNAGVGFSVDGIGEINQLDAVLAKKYKTLTFLREKQYPDKKIPWFNTLEIQDSVYDSLTHIFFWVMEYKPEYFDYNHWKHDDNKLNRITYLSQYEKERKDKILKRFTGITFKTSDEEKNVFSGFLLSCGYRKLNDKSFASPENFIIHFTQRQKEDRYSVASLEFESNTSRNDFVRISDNIRLEFHNKKGKIIFR